MDLKQRKLSKSEWESIEMPVSKAEIEILKLIINGYHDVNIKINKTDSIFTFLKIEYNPQIEEFFYIKYFSDKIKHLVETYKIDFIELCEQTKRNKPLSRQMSTDATNKSVYKVSVSGIVRLNSNDKIRIERMNSIDETMNSVYEFVLYSYLENMVISKSKNDKNWMKIYYTLNKLIHYNIEKVNKILKDIIVCFLHNFENDLNLISILENSHDYIEKNTALLKYTDLQLYEHQKEMFTAFKKEPSIPAQRSNLGKLVLYIAPTGTGKTLTPLGLSEKYKVIFVCAARHVGLALARSAISIHKKIAFAFGCSSAQDVRLHYFAAKEYTVHKRSGQIRKVDNAIGDKVEIIICDIRSYLSAMYYMLAFNSSHEIVTYWDEPTITMDYTQHDLHKVIKKNWKENIIPNFVLSSATLPKIHELTQTVADFKVKFPTSTVYNIVSHDCKKTIPLVDNNGFIVMPHYLSDDYSEIIKIVENCEDNLTLLRYFDLKEAAKFISYVEKNQFISSRAAFARNFASIDEIDMKSIKIHYLKTLKNVLKDKWPIIYNELNLSREKHIHSNNSVDLKGNKIARTTSVETLSLSLSGTSLSRVKSEQCIPKTEDNDKYASNSCGIYLTTKDAYTLTDGPAIFIAKDLQKIAKFCIQQANIPSTVMKGIVEKIEYNNQINEKIDELEKELELEEEKTAKKLGIETSKGGKSKKDKTKIAVKLVGKSEDKSLLQIKEQLDTLRGMIKSASLDDIFIPNKLLHLKKWTEHSTTNNVFTSNIDENVITSIMLLKDIDDSWKILLLMGIGVFTEHKSVAYTEIMKKLADSQKLYLIIADSDYIYGTNYQLCHAYLSKDLELTQEKIIQALGRVGRNNIQQEYSIRFRDNSQIKILFKKFISEEKPEVINMNQLFNCKNVKWNGSEYEEIPEEDCQEGDNIEEQDEDDEAIN